MSTGPDMPHDPAPLTTEERALAQRLAQLGARAEPSPALDARILAAAHAAVASQAARSPRRRMRVPLAFGVAASLALAVGVAWRLRPLPEATVQYESEAASAAAGMSAQDSQAPVEAATPAVEHESAPVDTADSAAPAATRVVVDIPSDAGSRIQATGAGIAAQAASQARREQPGRVTDQTAPDAFPPAAAQAPPAEPSQVAAPGEAPIVFEQPPSMAAPAPPPPPAPAAVTKPVAGGVAADTEMQRARQSQAQSESKAMAAESEIEMDIPPATADAPEVRDAWLQRIRELADAGELDDARASLREFTHRYPDHPLPDDLRALLP